MIDISLGNKELFSSLKVPKNGLITSSGQAVLIHNILLLANPRSGSRHAAKFIKKHGTGVTLEVKVVGDEIDIY